MTRSFFSPQETSGLLSPIPRPTADPLVSPTATVPDLIQGLEQALEEARLVSDLEKDRAITLVTDTGPKLHTEVFSNYLAGSPFRLAASEPRPFRSLGSIRRLLWTLKDEETGMNIYRDPDEAQRSLDLFRRAYNFDRPHQALGYKVPAALFCKRFIQRATS